MIGLGFAVLYERRSTQPTAGSGLDLVGIEEGITHHALRSAIFTWNITLVRYVLKIGSPALALIG
jgi:hypothetical protein